MTTSNQVDPRRSLYRPISEAEFRVVHLLPGAFNDDIRCVLETRPPSLKTRYKALSYQWGDPSITKPIRIAHLDAPPQPAVQTQRVPSRLGVVWSGIRAWMETHQDTLRWIASVVIATIVFEFFFLDPTVKLAVDAPTWASRFLPRDVYFFFFSAVVGPSVVENLLRTRELVLEVLRTKPWAIVSGFKEESYPELDFRRLEVTRNLEVALRYLRHEKRAVTLWIDALCINQADEEEKQVQIQRMDWVYANAAPILVWLGGYHDETRVSGDCEQGGRCEHKERVQAAFGLIWSQSGWRVLVPEFLNGGVTMSDPGARAGMRDLHLRGWWERLWVIQEVALATGPVELQCGHNKCYLEDFWSAHFNLRLDANHDDGITTASEPAEQFRVVTKDFRFDVEWEDQPETQGLLARAIFHITSATFAKFGVDVHENKTKFRDQHFPARVERLLLRTAGRFKCQEDRDRLYAIFGVAIGTKAGQNTKTRDFVRYLSAYPTSITLTRTLFEPALKSMGAPILMLAAYGLTIGLWNVYYDAFAKHWAINRAEYVIDGRREKPTRAITKLKQTASRVDFFTTLASYLATNTRTLAFLDAASCGEDADCDMPSWVPTWSRGVSEAAYNFAIRRERSGQATDNFHFTNEGKTLMLSGRPRGVVNVVRSQTADSTAYGPMIRQRLFESWLALPSKSKTEVVELTAAFIKCLKDIQGLRKIAVTTSDILLLEEETKKITAMVFGGFKGSFEAGEKFLKLGGDTLVYSFDRRAREMGFLKAGHAARGDTIVFVPGCYHHLLLRRQTGAEGARWNLVGLVEMGTPESRQAGCPGEKWAQYIKDGEVTEYAIV
ncbi:heterokaryon incompatibility protein-domain-containing protein [Cercophora newfieldiana]|uniref:Heterokaryon incompatibility protein-domain-containing protein n=1 Tax=Cercophora newfieldiana TaxID=92897 RepID=A0AA40CRC4_9PEZI|nr:heterokaryon incompatibility protein-domain-containing protein [Cercophora newfieldiana]